MTPDPITRIDALASPTLKDLREYWWDEEFTEFLTEMLRPRAGNRILDVGCGIGTGEISIGQLHVSQIRLFGIDRKVHSVAKAKQETAAHNQRVGFAAANACYLPFRDGVFDSTFCVAVLQHIRQISRAIREIARVTRAGGRVVAVEPDNGARYFYSSTLAGTRAFQMSSTFFAALAAARDDGGAPDIGPKISALFPRAGIEPLDVRMFPVSEVRLGTQPEELWRQRRARIERAIQQLPLNPVQEAGSEYLDAIDAYRQEAYSAGSSFVEIQNTMLFATVGQKAE
jgi:SAM-dependent methyltransferase